MYIASAMLEIPDRQIVNFVVGLIGMLSLEFEGLSQSEIEFIP